MSKKENTNNNKENKENDKSNESKQKQFIYYENELATVKEIKYCSQCGAKSSIISFPNDSTLLICNSCKSEFRLKIMK